LLIPIDLRKSIDASNFVSFDIFDTLILRNVYHFNDVFTVVEEEALRRHGIECRDFPALHIAAERRAREIREAIDGSREINLDRIYEVLIEYEGISSAEAVVLKSLELEYERKFCRANPFMLDVYEYCLKKGKRIGIVSDMYLPEDFLENVLADAGYAGYEFFLLSNSCGKRKRDGSIFPLLIKKTGLAANQILHIGDDRVSDFEMAGKFGLKAWFYQRCRDADADNSASLNELPVSVRHNTPALAIYNGIRANKLFSGRPLEKQELDEDFWYRLGYGKIGFVFLSFTCWLIENLKRENFEKVFFLSRDGYFVKQVYDLMSAREDNTQPPSAYLYASRRSLALAALDENNEARVDLFCGDSERLPLSAYLRRLGLNAADYAERIKTIGFSSPEHIVIPGRDDERLRKLMLSFADESARLAAHQKELLLRYLRQEGFSTCRKAAVVDIGWQGSMQKSLQNILADSGSKVSIKGFYLGTFSEARRIGHDEKSLSGWLCDFSYPQHIRKTILRCVPLLEFFHSAPYGSVYEYKESNAGIEPVFADNVIRKQLDQAAKMQCGALDFIGDWMDATAGMKWLKPTRDEAFSVISDILRKPDRLELAHLGDLKHVDSFDGIADARCLAKPPTWPGLVNIKKLRREYLKSHWKSAFIARLLNDSVKLPASLRRIISGWSQ